MVVMLPASNSLLAMLFCIDIIADVDAVIGLDAVGDIRICTICTSHRFCMLDASCDGCGNSAVGADERIIKCVGECDFHIFVW